MRNPYHSKYDGHRQQTCVARPWACLRVTRRLLHFHLLQVHGAQPKSLSPQRAVAAGDITV